MKKRLLSLLLAVAVVMTYAASAFAATPADVKGTDYQSAVEELSALGVLNGYPDGTFKPNNDISRAELAKVVVVASGNESAATLMAKVKPTFKDVKVGAWYTGFVNVAATKGLVKGDAGTNKYRPDDKIKFEEVVAILLRSLGYKDSKLSGAWPYNVILKAQDVGLLDGVDITTGAKANRGVVALLTSNTINSFLVSYNADGNEVVSSTPLVSKIGETSEAVLSDAALNINKQIQLNDLPANTADGFIVTGGKTLADLVGHTVSVTKKNGKVIAVSDAQAASNIITVKTAASTQSVAKANYITDNNGIQYPTATGTEYLGYKNNFVTKAIPSDIAGSTPDVTLFLNKVTGRVQFVSVISYVSDKTVYTVEQKNSYRSARLTFKDGQGSVNVADGASVTINGVAASLADVKEFDVVRYVTNGTAAVKVEVTRNAVTGAITSKYATGTPVYYVTIAGKEYKYIDAPNFSTLSVGTEYTAYLNKDGEIAYASAKNASLSSNYGVVVSATHHISAVVDGEVVVPATPGAIAATKIIYFSVKDNKNVTLYVKEDKYADAQTINKNDVIKLKFNGDGTLATDANGGLKEVATTAAAKPVQEITANAIKVVDAYYTLNSNTVVIDGTGLANEVASMSDLTKVHVGDAVTIAPNLDNPTAADVVLVNVFASGTDSAKYGLFVSRNTITSASGTTYSATLLVNGETKTYTISDTAWTGLKDAEDAYKLTAAHVDRHVVKVSGVGATDLTDPATSVATTSNALTTVSAVNKTFKVASDVNPWIVSNNTVIYVIAKDGTVNIGSFTDVNDASGALGGVATSKVTVTVTGTGVSYGSYNEAAAIVINTL